MISEKEALLNYGYTNEEADEAIETHDFPWVKFRFEHLEEFGLASTVLFGIVELFTESGTPEEQV